MKKWVRFAARLYPASWRRRYGTEFEALIDDTNPGRRELFDVLYGAIRMQLSMWSLRNLMLAGGLAGLTVAAAIAIALPNVYVSRALLRVSMPSSGATGAANDRVNQIAQEAFSRASLKSIIERPDLNLYQNERARKPLEDVIETMKQKDIKIELLRTGSSSTAFLVSFQYPDPVVAQKATSALIASMVDRNYVSGGKMKSSLDLVDPASLPRSPAAPNRMLIVLLGIGAGLSAGVMAWQFRRKTA